LKNVVPRKIVKNTTWKRSKVVDRKKHLDSYPINFNRRAMELDG
jgi:hypothetical protein